MNVRRPGRPFRRKNLFGAFIVPVLSLVTLAGRAPGAGYPRPQGGGGAVRVVPSDMDMCAAPARPGDAWDGFCLRGKVKALTDELRAARVEGGRVEDGELIEIVKESFDGRGRRTLREMSSNHPGPVGAAFSKLVYSYDPSGRMTGWMSYEAGSTVPELVVVLSYDERGNRVRAEATGAKPGARYVQEFTYDAGGRLVGDSFSRLTDGGWQTHRQVVTFEGAVAHVRVYSPDGALASRGTTLSDGRGHLLGEEGYRVNAQGEEELDRKVTYRYDPKGRLTEVIYQRAEERLGARAVYEYDESGNVTSLTRYNADGSFAASGHREYEYDAAGNWVRRVDSARSSEGAAPAPYLVERRHITYY
ncbi:MAG: hypothetical protein JOZ02_16645 [Acidobacteria bacterium]|nr:hypothetical protein [Acidobacteriota bacterium]